MRAYCNGKAITIKLQGKRVNILMPALAPAVDFLTKNDEELYTQSGQVFKAPAYKSEE